MSSITSSNAFGGSLSKIENVTVSMLRNEILQATDRFEVVFEDAFFWRCSLKIRRPTSNWEPWSCSSKIEILSLIPTKDNERCYSGIDIRKWILSMLPSKTESAYKQVRTENWGSFSSTIYIRDGILSTLTKVRALTSNWGFWVAFFKNCFNPTFRKKRWLWSFSLKQYLLDYMLSALVKETGAGWRALYGYEARFQ